MNTLIMKGSWNEFAGTLKEHFGELTDNRVLFDRGTDKKQLGIFQQQLGSIRENCRKRTANEKNSPRHSYTMKGPL